MAMIRPDEALEIVLGQLEPLGRENIPAYNALGRVIADKVVSKRDIPVMDSSAMDGYAVKYEDIAQTPAQLKVLGIIAAGDDVSKLTMEKGECWRIMTGAHVPVGADTVVERENTDDQMPVVTINKGKKTGDNIRSAREDIAKGAVVDFTGVRVSPYHFSRYMSVGDFYIPVFRKPRVAIISTGTEIADPFSYDQPGKMLDANAPALIGMLEESGAECSYMGVVPDEEKALLDTLTGLKGYDIIVVSGGISMGDFDYMAHISEKAGITWKFHNVNQKPGKPIAFGTIAPTGENRGTPIFGLPGNPVSCMFCAYFYIIPAVRKLQGEKDAAQKSVTALLGETVKKKKGRIQFDRVKLTVENGTLYAYPFRTQNSNIIDSMVHSNAFMRLEDELEGELAKGTPVKVYIFNSRGLFS